MKRLTTLLLCGWILMSVGCDSPWDGMLPGIVELKDGSRILCDQIGFVGGMAECKRAGIVYSVRDRRNVFSCVDERLTQADTILGRPAVSRRCSWEYPKSGVRLVGHNR